LTKTLLPKTEEASVDEKYGDKPLYNYSQTHNENTEEWAPLLSNMPPTYR